MPAILAILTFSKQMDINWDYIKDTGRDIYVKPTVEYRSLQVLQPKRKLQSSGIDLDVKIFQFIFYRNKLNLGSMFLQCVF